MSNIGWITIEAGGAGESLEEKPVYQNKRFVGRVTDYDASTHTITVQTSGKIAIPVEDFDIKTNSRECDCGSEKVWHDKNEEWICPFC